MVVVIKLRLPLMTNNYVQGCTTGHHFLSTIQDDMQLKAKKLGQTWVR